MSEPPLIVLLSDKEEGSNEHKQSDSLETFLVFVLFISLLIRMFVATDCSQEDKQPFEFCEEQRVVEVVFDIRLLQKNWRLVPFLRRLFMQIASVFVVPSVLTLLGIL
jgi:hypothetical protein